MEIIDKYNPDFDSIELRLISKKENKCIKELNFGPTYIRIILKDHLSTGGFCKLFLDEDHDEFDDFQDKNTNMPKNYDISPIESLNDWKTVKIPKDKSLKELYLIILNFFEETVSNNCNIILTSF